MKTSSINKSSNPPHLPIRHGKRLAIILSICIPLLAVAGYIGYNQYSYQSEKSAYAQLDVDMTALRDRLRSVSPEGIIWEKSTSCEHESRYMMERPVWSCTNKIFTVAASARVDDDLLVTYGKILNNQEFLVVSDAESSPFLESSAVSRQYKTYRTKVGQIICAAAYRNERDEKTVYISLDCGSVKTKDGWYPGDPDYPSVRSRMAEAHS